MHSIADGRTKLDGNHGTLLYTQDSVGGSQRANPTTSGESSQQGAFPSSGHFVLWALQKPWSDGTSSVELSPLALIARLAAFFATRITRSNPPCRAVQARARAWRRGRARTRRSASAEYLTGGFINRAASARSLGRPAASLLGQVVRIFTDTIARWYEPTRLRPGPGDSEFETSLSAKVSCLPYASPRGKTL